VRQIKLAIWQLLGEHKSEIVEVEVQVNNSCIYVGLRSTVMRPKNKK